MKAENDQTACNSFVWGLFYGSGGKERNSIKSTICMFPSIIVPVHGNLSFRPIGITAEHVIGNTLCICKISL